MGCPKTKNTILQTTKFFTEGTAPYNENTDFGTPTCLYASRLPNPYKI
jgi:hypothetical protein